jgi:signal transduction histidine kinase/ligand-binding sensor domain-containing protein
MRGAGRWTPCGSEAPRGLKPTLLLACLLLSAAGGYALDPSKALTQYSHRIWDQEEGMLEPTVYAILPSHDGYLWLGTQSGVVRFDGERFRPIRISPSAEPEPVLIRSLYEDKQGTLWAGSVGNGLLEISRTAKRWFKTSDGLPSDIVTCVVPHGAAGSLWVCTNQGLVDFNNGPKKTYTVADGLPSNRVSGICEARDGTEWISTFDRGLATRKGGKFSPFDAGRTELSGDIRELRCSNDGSIWAASDHGLFRISGSGVEQFTAGNGLLDGDILSLDQSSDGSIFVGTQTGIARYRNHEWSVYGTKDGLSHTAVFSLLSDREGSLWAGTKNGLDQFTDSRVTPYTTSEGMPTNDTGPVVEDKSGTLWIGTPENGLIRYDGHRFSSVTKANGLLDDGILSLLPEANGDLLAGTEKGLNRLRKGKVIASYTRRDGLAGNEINSLFQDAEGALWVGTEAGLSVMKSGRVTRVDQLDQLPREHVVALGGGRTTRLFVSTSSGHLYCMRNGKMAALPSSDPTRAIASYYHDAEHRSIWMGTLGSGLIRLRGGGLTHVRVKDGLFDDKIYAILPDDHENFWFASSKGIFRCSRKDLEDFTEGKTRRVSSLPFTTGQVRFECQSGVNPAAWRTHDGRLWFSTTSGLVVVDPNHLAPNTLPPPTQIETLFVNGQRREAAATLQLAPFEKNLEIRYAGLSFVTPEKVAFRYILDGYDKEWVEAGTRREAFYTNLPPGHFRFRVIASNSDGIWSTKGASLDFTIEPRLYQRRWFFPLLGVLAGLAVWLGYQIRVRNLRRQFNLVLSERTRIARELHDTLLQGLSGVTMQLQALWTHFPPSSERRTLEEIIKDAGKCLTEARQSLWGLRNRTGSDNGISDRLTRQAQQALAAAPIKLVLRITPTPPPLSPEVEYQLLRIAQEAVSNAVQHAEPKTVEVRLECVDDGLELLVRDDGAGFSTETQHAELGHYGLLGMQERAGEIGARLMITSVRGLGTDVKVMVKTRKLGTQDQSKTAHPAEASTADEAGERRGR